MTTAPPDFPSLRESQLHMFIAQIGWADATLHPLAGDASFRRYIRLKRGKESAMLMDAPPPRENVRPFIAVNEHLCQTGYSAPRILARDAAQGFLLLEDLGDDLFTPLLADGTLNEQEAYREAVALLIHWHHNASMQRSHATLALPLYDVRTLLQEAQLFADWYLPAVADEKALPRLQNEFMQLWERLIATTPLITEYFVHRDYHASNLLWLNKRQGAKRIGLLDFQDALWGHPAYDLVSLLEDARRDVPPAIQAEMLNYYIGETNKHEIMADVDAFKTAYALLGAQRNCKIIGIFVRLMVRDGKPVYLRHLPRVWKYLEHDVAHPMLAPLANWLEENIPVRARGALTFAKR